MSRPTTCKRHRGGTAPDMARILKPGCPKCDEAIARGEKTEGPEVPTFGQGKHIFRRYEAARAREVAARYKRVAAIDRKD